MTAKPPYYTLPMFSPRDNPAPEVKYIIKPILSMVFGNPMKFSLLCAVLALCPGCSPTSWAHNLVNGFPPGRFAEAFYAIFFGV